MNGPNRRNLGVLGLGFILTIVALVLASAGGAGFSNAPPPLLVSLKVAAPASTAGDCASCHCDPRGASMGYPAHSPGGVVTDTLTLQDFIKESQYVPLLVRQSSHFCGSGHANPPGEEEDNVIQFLQLQEQPGT